MKFKKKSDGFLLFAGFLLLTVVSVGSSPIGKYCETRAAFNLPAVTPMWEEQISAIGCFSKNTTTRGQEVHVLHLKAVEGWPTPKVVTVHVRPHDEDGYKKPFVLLLHSEFTVSWKLIGDERVNSTYHRIIVTHSSQVIENRDLQMTVQRRTSGDMKHLLVWLNKRYKSVTSYTKMEGANKIFLSLGFKGAVGTPTKCEINSRKKVPHVVAYAQDTISINQRQGCVAGGSAGNTNRIVHIIKIHETRRDSDNDDAVSQVTVHVNSRSGQYPLKDVALVLHSSQPVEWMLVNEFTKGRLDIVTDGKVNTPREVLMSEISVRTEALPNSTKELMSYTVDWFGPSFTYTEVWRANSIKVFVDVFGEGPPPPPKDVELSYPIVEQTGPRPRAIGTKDSIKSRLRHGHTRADSQTHMLVKAKRPMKANDIIRMPSVMLIDVMAVECLPQHMRVSFPRLSMEQLGFQANDISLIDSHCSVTVNDTHFVLFSPFHFCGTKTEVDHERIVYKNAVHFHFHVQKIGSLSSASLKEVETSTLPVDDEDGAGSGSSSLSAGANADSSEANTLEFQCEYNNHGSPPQIKVPDSPPTTRDTTTMTAARDLFSMDLSRDPSFVRRVKSDEYPFVAFEHDSLYFETRLDAGSALQVVTEECWLSETNDPKAAQAIKLISNGCPTGPSVRFESTGDLTSNRFSFQLGSEYLNHQTLFLHCNLGVCGSDKVATAKWGLKLCIDPKDFCMIESFRSYLELPRGTHHNVFSRGPFHVKKRPSGSRNPFSSIPFRQQGKLDLEVLGSETVDIRCTIPEQPAVILLGLSTESVIGIAFASFIIGVGLSAVLWCIYLKTDPLRAIHRRSSQAHHHHHHSGYDLSGHSGSSTPSSQSPLEGTRETNRDLLARSY